MCSQSQKWWDCDVMRFSDADLFDNYNFKVVVYVQIDRVWLLRVQNFDECLTSVT